MAASRVWLITGASAGIGLELAKIAASQGHRVIAASRNPSKISGLKGIEAARLDHNEPLEKVQADIDAIIAKHGTLDVVVNNAAYVQSGTVEETTPEETQRQFQANTFGPINVYRAVLPCMRAKGSGTLVTVGSMAAWYPMNSCNLYNASKAALRWLVIGLAAEIEPFGIKHCLVEPGFFRTDLLKPDSNYAKTSTESRISDYDKINHDADEAFKNFHGTQLGDPVRGAKVMYDVITSSGSAAGRELPGLLPLGSDANTELTKSAQGTIDQVKAWSEVAAQSDFPDAK
jgi:NAD(P)-dependent dehydrogenase (short-subunit alcohol dehydrogenase family)